MATDFKKLGRRNKQKGKEFEREILGLYKNCFPSEKFARVPDSRAWEMTETKGDLILPEDFFYRSIECRKRDVNELYNFYRFFYRFNTSVYKKWIDECNGKFDEPWIVVFKLRGSTPFVICKDDLKIKEHIFNGEVYVYRIQDFLDWLVVKMKERRNKND